MFWSLASLTESHQVLLFPGMIPSQHLTLVYQNTEKVWYLSRQSIVNWAHLCSEFELPGPSEFKADALPLS